MLLLVKVYYVAVKAALKAFKLRAVAVRVYAHAVAVFACTVPIVGIPKTTLAIVFILYFRCYVYATVFFIYVTIPDNLDRLARIVSQIYA